MKVFFTIWILAVIIQEVVPGTLVRLPRNALNRKSSVQTEYEAKYEQQGKHGHQSYSTVTGKQEIVHDDCGENWNAFAEKCATLIKDLIASLATAVKSNPGDATNLQLHIKNNFKHFDNTHNCTCLTHAGKGLKDLDLSPLFNNITITTSCPNSSAQALSKKPEVMSSTGTSASPNANSNSNKVLSMPTNSGVNPEDADPFGDDLTTNNRREVDNVPISSPGSTASSSTLPNGLRYPQQIQSQTPSTTQLGSSSTGSENPAPILNNVNGPNNALPAIEPRESDPNGQLPGSSSNLHPNNNIVGSGTGHPQEADSQFIPSAIPGSKGANQPSQVVAPVTGTNGISGPVQSPVAPIEPSNQVLNSNGQNTGTPEENWDNPDYGSLADLTVDPTEILSSPSSSKTLDAPQQTISSSAPESAPQGKPYPFLSKQASANLPIGHDSNSLAQTPSGMPSNSQEPVSPVNPDMVQAAVLPVNSISPEMSAFDTPETISDLTQKPMNSVTSEAPNGLSQQPTQQIIPGEAIGSASSGAPSADIPAVGERNDAGPVSQIPSTFPTESQNSIAPTAIGTPSVQPQKSLNPVAPETVASGTPDQENCDDSESSGAGPAVSQQSISPVAPGNGQISPYLPQEQLPVTGNPKTAPSQSVGQENYNTFPVNSQTSPEQQISPQQPANSFAPLPQNPTKSGPVLPEQVITSPNTVPEGVSIETLPASSNTPTLPQQSQSPIPSKSVLPTSQQTANPESPESILEENYGSPGPLGEGPDAPVKQPNSFQSGTPQGSPTGTSQDSLAPVPVQPVPAAPQQTLNPITPDVYGTPVNNENMNSAPVLSQSPTNPVASNLGTNQAAPAFDQSPLSPVDPGFSQSPISPDLAQGSLSPVASEGVPVTPGNSVIQSPTTVGSTPSLTSANHISEPTSCGHENGGEGCDTNESDATLPESGGQLESSKIPVKGTSVSPSTNVPVQPNGLSGSPNSASSSVPQVLIPNSQSDKEDCEPSSTNAPVQPNGLTGSPNSASSSVPQVPIPNAPSNNENCEPSDSENCEPSSTNVPVQPNGLAGSPNSASNSAPQVPITKAPSNNENCEPSDSENCEPSSTNVPVQPNGLTGSPNSASNSVPQVPISKAPSEENCESPEDSLKDSTAPGIAQVGKPEDPNVNSPIQSSALPGTTGALKPTPNGAVGSFTPIEYTNQLGQPSSGATQPTSSGNTPLTGVPQTQPSASGPVGSLTPLESSNQLGQPASGTIPPTSSGNTPLTGVPQSQPTPNGAVGSLTPLESSNQLGQPASGAVPSTSSGNTPLTGVPQSQPTPNGAVGNLTPLESSNQLGQPASGTIPPTSSGNTPLIGVPQSQPTPNGAVGSLTPLDTSNQLGQPASGTIPPTSSGNTPLIGVPQSQPSGNGPVGSLTPLESSNQLGQPDSGTIPPTSSGNTPLIGVPQSQPTPNGAVGSLTPLDTSNQLGQPASGTTQPTSSGNTPLIGVPQSQPSANGPVGSLTPLESSNQLGQPGSGAIQPTSSGNTPLTGVPQSQPTPNGAVGSLTPLDTSNQLGQPGSGTIPLTPSANTPGVSDSATPLGTNILPNNPSQTADPSIVYQPQPVYPTAPSVPVDSLEEDEDLRPTTYQTTSVEPTRPQNPPILTIPLSHTVPPHSDEVGSPYSPSASSHPCPKHGESGHEGDEEDEDCCSCESCTEEISNPNEYRANACKDLEDARRELKVIFDKIKKRLKCGKKFKPIPTAPAAGDQAPVVQTPVVQAAVA